MLTERAKNGVELGDPDLKEFVDISWVVLDYSLHMFSSAEMRLNQVCSQSRSENNLGLVLTFNHFS